MISLLTPDERRGVGIFSSQLGIAIKTKPHQTLQAAFEKAEVELMDQ